MANRFKKCSICGKRKRATIISITPSPYEVNPDAEICVEICPQPPTKICNACFHQLNHGINELLTWYFTPFKYSLAKKRKYFSRLFKKDSKTFESPKQRFKARNAEMQKRETHSQKISSIPK